ncbi:MAG TPA: SRPBCC family protein [Pseudacidobacterium sp.]|nr:SRPBCC family protein [Pseudacidobacterium sp.]
MSETLAPVVKTVTVNASREKAFRIFTEFFGGWWPSTHHIGKHPFETAILEGRVGGRWYERMTNGEECNWGHVKVWDPPARVVLSWHVQPDWGYDPDPEKASEVEVRFIPESETVTRVELQHRNIERHGALAGKLREGVSDGWPTVMDLYARFANEQAGEK